MSDLQPIERALQLAEQAVALTNPNPRVGCVIVDAGGRVIGEGHTQRAGSAHAEVMALRDAASRGLDVSGATAYVTLEPCSHRGRTPPCCDALIAARLHKVVASLPDPNPLVAGRGFERLRAAGIEVEVGPGAVQAREQNLGFFSRMIRRRPWVRMKVAASLDGRTALADGRSQWITSTLARQDGHRWRARACAVLTGIGTVLEDNPRMNARIEGLERQPHRIIVDSRLQTPAGAAILDGPGFVWLYAAVDDAASRQALLARGADIRMLPGPGAKVDLDAMLSDLANREVNELHVEAGHKLNGSLLRAGLVDELLLYVAPRLLGEGRGIAALPEPRDLDSALAFEFVECAPLGPDLRLRARIPGRDRF